MILYISIWFTSTTSLNDITYSLEKLLSPLKIFKVDIHSLAFVIALSLRFIPVILGTSDKILKSQASRGADYYNTSIKNKLLIMKSLIIPVFVSSLRSADELGDALTVKFYKVGQKRVYTNIKKWGTIDTILCLSYGLVPILLYL
jgi:energy-coupling factor transport system permease protein